MALQPAPPMTVQEVGTNPCLRTFIWNIAVIDYCFFFPKDLCVEEHLHDSPREDALQNISTDDLPDSASQTAQQHDSKFSFRLFTVYDLTLSSLHVLATGGCQARVWFFL